MLPGLAVAGVVLVVTGHLSTTRTRHTARTGEPPPVESLRSGAVPHLPRRPIRGRTVVAVVGVLVALLLGPLAMLAAMLSVVAVARMREIGRRRRAQRDIDRDLPEALDLFVLLLEAGVSTRSVITEMARRGPISTRPAFAQVADRLTIGEPFADAIVQLRTHLGPGAVALVDLVTASNRYGLPMAQVVSQLSTEARAARRRRNEALARALPVRLSFPLVVCTLPSFVLLAIVPAVMAALASLGSDAW